MELFGGNTFQIKSTARGFAKLHLFHSNYMTTIRAVVAFLLTSALLPTVSVSVLVYVVKLEDNADVLVTTRLTPLGNSLQIFL